MVPIYGEDNSGGISIPDLDIPSYDGECKKALPSSGDIPGMNTILGDDAWEAMYICPTYFELPVFTFLGLELPIVGFFILPWLRFLLDLVRGG